MKNEEKEERWEFTKEEELTYIMQDEPLTPNEIKFLRALILKEARNSVTHEESYRRLLGL